MKKSGLFSGPAWTKALKGTVPWPVLEYSKMLAWLRRHCKEPKEMLTATGCYLLQQYGTGEKFLCHSWRTQTIHKFLNRHMHHLKKRHLAVERKIGWELSTELLEVLCTSAFTETFTENGRTFYRFNYQDVIKKIGK